MLRFFVVSLALLPLVFALACGSGSTLAPNVVDDGTKDLVSGGDGGPGGHSSVLAAEIEGGNKGEFPGRSEDPLGVAISPQNLILDSEQGSLSAHSSIPYHSVEPGTVELNGIPATYCFPDDCGELVAKFDEWEIKAIVSPPEETMTLTGLYTDGTEWSGTDTVKVMQ